MPTFSYNGDIHTYFLNWFSTKLSERFLHNGFDLIKNTDNPRLVFNFIAKENPRPYRRKKKATFVVSVVESYDSEDVMKEAYPLLVRSLANHLIYIVHSETYADVHFITPEQGFYSVRLDLDTNNDSIFDLIYEKLKPLALSNLIIDNEFYLDPDMIIDPPGEMKKAGKILDQMNLLPAPFPIENYLSNRDMRQLKRLYGIGGLSYGNFSMRYENTDIFYMTASGIDKSNIKMMGKDVLFISGYDEKNKKMEITVPEDITEPNRASVDAIEHHMIYKENPNVGAILHIHAWMDDIESTEINYPCGTYELACEVAEKVNLQPNPNRAVIGLKNHGLTITGYSLDDIFKRIEGKIIRQIPMAV